ncbi:hypothetical protein [Pedobacter agri]|uniref:Uncharacterized protein n=1 Tax=Pedobacter agri TaxID=454586 RepID=A0A9X3DBL0_9SPHI|nr:hypothetical protein [Pedobacter agri]MCX3263130.1 hypothetical protein [Pedobacter agri]
MKNRKGRVAWDSGGLKVFAQALTFSLFIISYARAGCLFRAVIAKEVFSAVAAISFRGHPIVPMLSQICFISVENICEDTEI